ncbi:unnamed protein product [Sphagnum jensenii]|uniref:Uncharacterized protein n=1 Tax=Sphagnum jensenii TaxID=128206 RepID=A0ABP0WEN4_9BRYO
MSAGAIRIYEDARATACSLSSLQMHQQQCGPAAAAAARDETSPTAAVAAVAPPLEEALNRATTLYVNPEASYLAG